MAVITISRQFGAGGKTHGKMIADKLGYTFADDDIIQMVAEAANVSPHWVESVEREAGGKLSRAISSMVRVSKLSADRALARLVPRHSSRINAGLPLSMLSSWKATTLGCFTV